MTRNLDAELAQDPQQPSGVGAVPREIPREVALRDASARESLYQSIQWTNSKSQADVKATVLLISGCQDNQLSMDGTFNGLFTGTLKTVWNGGTFDGSYRRFHTAIGSKMPPDQTPKLSLARANAQWRVATFGDQPQTLQAEVAGLALGPQRADNLRLDVRGTLEEHRIEVSGAMPVLPPAALENLLGLESQTGTRALLVAQGGWQADAAPAAASASPGAAAQAPFASGRYRARLERLVVGSWDGSSGSAPPTAGWAETRDVAAELSFSAGRLTTLRADAGRLQVGEGLSMRWDEVRLDLRSEQPLIHLRAEVDPFLLAPMLARLQPGTGWGGDLKLAARVDVRAAERMDADIVFERREGDLHIAGPDGTQLLGLSELRLAVTAAR